MYEVRIYNSSGEINNRRYTWDLPTAFKLAGEYKDADVITNDLTVRSRRNGEWRD